MTIYVMVYARRDGNRCHNCRSRFPYLTITTRTIVKIFFVTIGIAFINYYRTIAFNYELKNFHAPLTGILDSKSDSPNRTFAMPTRSSFQIPSINAASNLPMTSTLSDVTVSHADARGVLAIKDILITVKTTKFYHESRVTLLLKTWIKKTKNQTLIITDEQEDIVMKSDANLISTSCGTSHNKTALCCKTGVEFDTFLERMEKWWCHFDDDNYVNVDRLVELLSNYDWRKPYYVGRRSRDFQFRTWYKGGRPEFYWFATGGAGYCVSRTMANLMEPWCRNGKFEETCRDTRNTDDCTLGFIITNRLKYNLTESMLLHSHTEKMSHTIDVNDLKLQVSFSYKGNNVTPFNFTLSTFTRNEDPTRFLSIHCMLYSDDEICT